MAPVFVKQSRVVMKVLRDVMNSAENKNQTGKGFDIQDLYFRYTLASITEIGFGMDIGCITQKTVPFAKYCNICIVS